MPPNHLILCTHFSCAVLSCSMLSDYLRAHGLKSTGLLGPWDTPGKNTGVGCRFLLQCMKVKKESEVTQSCPTVSNPVDCSLPDSSVHGIFQARVLEWVAIAFSSHHLRRPEIKSRYRNSYKNPHSVPERTPFKRKSSNRCLASYVMLIVYL